MFELDLHGDEKDGHEDGREAEGSLLLHRSSWKRLCEQGFLISFAYFFGFLFDAAIEKRDGGEPF